MHKFKVEKLVRDKIAEKMITSENAGYKVLNDKEYIEELKNKILEETRELLPAKKRSKILKELADIQEIVDALIQALKSSKKELKTKQKKKKKKKKWGGFKKRLYIESIELEDNHPWLDYYLKNPDKYPKIKK
jgi:predicted house-cleaning noncanonical NTP pyrophosphatase (MazG superfamily)